MDIFTKPFSPVAEQVELLKQRGMGFSDEEKAQRCLGRVGYYRLSAYWYPFREKLDGFPISDAFKAGTTFDEVFDFYVFDKCVRLLISDGLERIEIALRAQISDQLGVRDAWAHRNAQELHGQFDKKPSGRNPSLTKHQDWLAGQDKNFKHSKEDFAKHFRAKYSGSPPIWIAKEVWDWGMLSHLYDGLKHPDKDGVANTYGNITGKEMVTWVRAMNDARNVCAHHSRIWNRAFAVTLRMPRRGVCLSLDHIVENTHSLSRLYGVLTIMTMMLRVLHPNTQWHRRVIALAKDAPKNTLIGPRTAGFPDGWDKEAIWLDKR